VIKSVLLNSDGYYTVAGYNERAAECFGQIYLGLDAGPEYYKQSGPVNEALQAITAGEAFHLALFRTEKNRRSPLAGALSWHGICDWVLANICTDWFDIPDDTYLRAGGWGLSTVALPPRCPRDFAFPSGYIFNPTPPWYLSAFGKIDGKLLKSAITEFVAAVRTGKAVAQGKISQVILQTFPNDNDLAARTVCGVMMGMLPTISGNFANVVKHWQADGIFDKLQTAVRNTPGNDKFALASDILKTPLFQTMRQEPVPDSYWRRATKDHRLGTIEVKTGDMIYLDVAAATQDNGQDVSLLFGGLRTDNPHPLHACPAYPAGIGILLGILYGVMLPA
jgi:hypothetical protein